MGIGEAEVVWQLQNESGKQHWEYGKQVHDICNPLHDNCYTWIFLHKNQLYLKYIYIYKYIYIVIV